MQAKTKVNNVKSSEQWLTLQEASKITGIKTPTLRQGIKRGKYQGEQVNTSQGRRWLINPDSLGIAKKVDSVKLNAYTNEQCSNEHNTSEQGDKYLLLLMKQQSERISEQSKHITTLEKLLTDFQARTNILESDKLNLEYQIKLLPAPPEIVNDELQKNKETMAMLQRTIKDLEAEKKKPWWKKIFRIFRI